MAKNEKNPKKTQGSAGGAAAAGGVGFQQRLAAFAMAHALVGLDDLSAVGLGQTFGLRSVHLETANAIDDVVLVGQSCRALIQAKRTLAISDKPTSAYSSVLAQFVQHHLTSRRPGDRYVLATSLGSSERVIFDLRKLTDSVRLNTDAFAANPLTQAEQEVLSKTRKLIAHHIALLRPGPASNTEVDEIVAGIWVVPLDIEPGGRDEATAVTILRSRSTVDPKLIWDALVGLASTLAQQRSSVDIAGLLTRLGGYVKPETEVKTIEDEFRFEIVQMNDVASGKEVVVFDGAFGTDKLAIIELYRFADDGSRRVRFKNNECMFPDGTAHKYLFRAATLAGTERFFESNPSITNEREVVLMPYTGEDNPDQGPWALARRDLIGTLMREKKDIFRCLVCGDSISENKALVAEIDEEGLALGAGYAHQRCHRPSLRVLGEIRSELFAKYTALKNFDYQAWIAALRYGRGILLETPVPDQLVTAAWKPGIPVGFGGNWCVQINISDGSSFFATDRGKVMRFGQPDVVETAQKMNAYIEHARSKKDPLCISSDRRISGTYSELTRRLKAGERLLKWTDAQVVPFTPAIDAAYSARGSHYAPLVLLVDVKSGRPMILGGAVFMISDPFQLAGHLENWDEAGLKVPDYRLEIIADDQSFDALFLRCRADGLQVVIDPAFDLHGHPTLGIVVEPLNALLAER